MRREWAPPERVARAFAYEAAAQRSGHGFPIPLYRDRAFWSKGWKACHLGCRHRVDDWTLELSPMIHARPGSVTIGWRCSTAGMT